MLCLYADIFTRTNRSKNSTGTQDDGFSSNKVFLFSSLGCWWYIPPRFAIFKYSNAEKCCLRYQTMTTQHSILCKTLQFFIKRQLKTFQELCAEFLREWWKQLWSLFTPGRNSYSESIEMISFRVAYRHVMNGREWRPQFLFISMVES